MTDEQSTKYRDIPIQQIFFGDRYRQDYGDMEDFIENIKDVGLIQPVSVSKVNEHTFRLLAGGRRLTACKSLEWKTIPAVIRDENDDLDAREIELFENLFRKDMEWQEKVSLVKEIQLLHEKKFGELAKWKWSERKTAALLGLSQSNANRKLTLAKAMEVFPELADCKTEEEARKKLRKLEDNFVTAQLLKEQKVHIAEQKEQGIVSNVQRGQKTYMVGDAFEGMEKMLEEKDKLGPYGKFTFFEVDPPYSIDLKKQKRRDEEGDNDDLERYTEIEAKEYTAFLRRTCNLCYELAEDESWMVFWYGPTWHTDVKVALALAGWNPDPIPCIWDKGYGQTNAPDVNLARTYEPFFVARKGKANIKNKGRANVFRFSPVPSGSKFHPTQRPIELMREILDTFCYPSTNIIVPFLGSGVTLRAAYQLHMNGFGWDLDHLNKKQFLLTLDDDERDSTIEQ